MSESNFYHQLKKNLPHVIFTRIENRHGGGVPDVNCLCRAKEFWIELKVTKNNSVRISPTQVAWHTYRYANGGKSFFLVKSEKTKCIYLYNNEDARSLNKIGLKHTPVLIISPRYDWQKLLDTLLTLS